LNEQESIKEGAEIPTRGEQMEGRNGYFYRPTVLKNVTPKMHIAQEVFGPVAPIIVAADKSKL
jgi:acyl-CoA reductase-like NAD-dependent aldehyde dehydrogenase